jgi:hypothetical protein
MIRYSGNDTFSICYRLVEAANLARHDEVEGLRHTEAQKGSKQSHFVGRWMICDVLKMKDVKVRERGLDLDFGFARFARASSLKSIVSIYHHNGLAHLTMR